MTRNQRERLVLEQRILEECKRRGIRVSRRGIAWKLLGAGIDILTTDLMLLRLSDLDRAGPTGRRR